MGFNLKSTKNEKPKRTSIPTGRYNVTIEKVDLTTSSTGNPMIKMQMSVADGEFEGRKCFDQIPLVDTVLWKIRSILEAAKSGLAEAEDVEAEEIMDDLLGRKVSAYLEATETNTGNPTNNVSGYQAIATKPSLF